MSKDCDRRLTGRRLAAVVALLGLTAPAAVCRADDTPTVRLLPRAVVMDDEIRLGDLSDLLHFDADTHERMVDTVVTEAPPPGGSKAISLQTVRDTVAVSGVNMARTIVKGATECAVTRPRVLPASARVTPAVTLTSPKVPTGSGQTLRQAVVDFFQSELAEYEGDVRVDFGRRELAALDLGGPAFEFDVERRSGRPLGLIDIQVHVRQAGRTVQTVDLQPIVTFSRRVVVARNGINQKASIRREDIRVTEMTFDRLNRLGIADPTRVVAQRAKRFIPAGTLIELSDVETVPLVNRGQLVQVFSSAGGIAVETVAKAMQSGALGETIELRSGSGRRGRLLVGVVTGPGRVELQDPALAMNGDPDNRLAAGGGGR